MKKKTMKDLCSKIAHMEGGKHQASIGDIREIFRCFADLCAIEDKTWLDCFAEYACKRANRKVKSK